MVEKQEKIGNFLLRFVGKNHIIVFPHPDIYTNCCIPMTGADVTVEITIPYFHRINKLVLIHLDSSYDKSTDALDVDFECKQGKSTISPKWTDMLFQEDNIAVAEITEVFGEGFEYEPRTWSLTLNTTNTDLVIVVLYIQKEANS